MSIVLNVVAPVVLAVLSHRVVSIYWFNAYQDILTRRLLDTAILPAAERSTLNLRAALTPIVALATEGRGCERSFRRRVSGSKRHHDKHVTPSGRQRPGSRP